MPMHQRISISLFLITMITGCESLPDHVEHYVAPTVTSSSSALSQSVATYQLKQFSQQQSGVLLLDSGWDALAQRLALIEAAEQSIDIQYYIWNSDASGRYLASRLLAAADRGVRVRVMLDDININGRDEQILALDHHPHIEMRIFNPIPSRNGVAKWLNVLRDFSRLNRRMHNKSFTVDGAISIVGGRNIGDEYFDLSNDINFRDRDVMVMGAVLPDIQHSFTQYWNSHWSYPISLLTEAVATDITTLNDVPAPLYKHYPALPEGRNNAKRFLTESLTALNWVNAQFISDRPVPIDAQDSSRPKATAKLLAELAKKAEQEVLIESAYLIFDDRQLDDLSQLVESGVKVKALTNSMASNDLVTNHSGYAGRRQDMLEHGIQLYELKPDTALCESASRDASKCVPSIPYGLHAKSAVFDRRIACVGSFNFNLRSTYLNTESILVIEDSVVAKRLADDITGAMHEDNSWRLALYEGVIRWYSGTKSWVKEPQTGQWERIESRLLQLLPIEKYL